MLLPDAAKSRQTENKMEKNIESVFLGAEPQINPVHRIFFPSSSDALISYSLFSISLLCERAVSIMPQVHIKEMGTGWYLQLSLLTQPWAARHCATAGSLSLLFSTHTHTHAPAHYPPPPSDTYHPFLTFTCQAA